MASSKRAHLGLRGIAFLCVLAFGCGGSEGGGGEDEAPLAKVTAENFAELAAASAEAIRGVWLAEQVAIGLASASFGLARTPADLGDETTYRYTGNLFDVVSGRFRPGDGPHQGQSVTVSMTTDAPMPPDSVNFAPTILAIAVSDGVSTLTPGNATGLVARITTDGVGDILEWAVDARRDPDVFRSGDIFIRTCNPGATIPATGSGPDAGDCDPNDRQPVVDAGSLSRTVGGDSGGIEGNPGQWTTDMLCISGTSDLIPDAANPERYEVEFADCVLPLQGERCTVNGRLDVVEGGSGTPLSADGIELQVDCAEAGLIDLGGSGLSCDYAGGLDPSFDNVTCAFDVPSIRGAVSGLEIGTAGIETSGPVNDVEAAGTFVDPDNGELVFEAIDLDLRCPDGTPRSGRIGVGREFGIAPQLQAAFDACTEFPACFFATQAELDAFQCTTTSVVTWADVAGG